MGKIMKFPFLSKTSEKWPWPCAMVGTLSFRADNNNTGDSNVFKILNSAYNLECDSSSSSMDDEGDIEEVIRGLRSERLIFKPAEERSVKSTGRKDFLIKDSVAVEMEMDSTDPFVDFKRSMVEMVEAHHDGFRDWEFLEELLIWYLRINGKTTHGYIVGAFVDLLVGISIASETETSDTAAAHGGTEPETAAPSSCSSSSSSSSLSSSHSHSFTSPLSFSSSVTFSTPPYFSLQKEDCEDDVDKSSHHHASSPSSSSHRFHWNE